jgi:hypothetical protein
MGLGFDSLNLTGSVSPAATVKVFEVVLQLPLLPNVTAGDLVHVIDFALPLWSKRLPLW